MSGSIGGGATPEDAGAAGAARDRGSSGGPDHDATGGGRGAERTGGTERAVDLGAGRSADRGTPAPAGSRASGGGGPNGSDPILIAEGLKKYYPVRGGVLGGKIGEVRAVDGVSFSIQRGETLGLVGESGCGKSTLGRALNRLEAPTAGRVLFEGKDVAGASGKELFQLRRDIQMIFQDPYSSLNPRMTVGEIVREPLLVHRVGTKAEQIEKVRELLEVVGLSSDLLGRYPHEFSGGQRQRVGLARALALEPKLVIADEPVSALDVSVQSQVLNLMVGLQQERNLTYLFITHDLSVVEYASDAIAIMYLGRIVEIGPVDVIFGRPAHPYTRALIQAIPVPDPARRHEAVPLQGETPSPVSPPSGCPFHPRCPFAIPECSTVVPVLEAVRASGGSGGRGDEPDRRSEGLAGSEQARGLASGAAADPAGPGTGLEVGGTHQHLAACIRKGEI